MLQKVKENWEAILNTLKEDQELTDVSFKTWLLPLELVSADGHVLTILFPGDKPSVSYIEKKYKFFLQVAIEEVTGLRCEVHFITPHAKEEAEAKKNRVDLTLSAEANLNPRYPFDTFVVGSHTKMAHAASRAVAESPAEI